MDTQTENKSSWGKELKEKAKRIREVVEEIKNIVKNPFIIWEPKK